MKKKFGALKSLLRFVARSIAIVLLVSVTFLVAFLAFLILTPSFHVTVPQARSLIARFAPENLQISFDDLQLSLTIPEGHLLAKHLTFGARNFCVRYAVEAADVCFSQMSLGASAGWITDSTDGPERSKWMPRLISIDPLVLLGGNIALDLPKFPKTEKKETESNFDVVQFLRTEVLPKWQMAGSRVELASFLIKTTEKDGYRARFDLTTGEDQRTLKAQLHEFSALTSPLKAKASLSLTRPTSWTVDLGPKDGDLKWKFLADGDLTLDRKRSVKLKADADIESWQSLDFRVATWLKGIVALREARVSGAIRNANNFDGLLSLKAGATGSQIQAVDFVNCALKAELEKKIGALSCGPQTVRLKLTEQAFLRRPDLFLLAPQFDLKISNLKFGENKGADFKLDVRVDHAGMIRAQTTLSGNVSAPPEGSVLYSVNGDGRFVIRNFAGVVDLLRETPYSIPAPLNVLGGRLGLAVDLDWTQDGGRIVYRAGTRLDSPNQAVHLRLEGATALTKTGPKGALEPVTQANLFIDSLRISAPRFDLRVPPRFAPDSRFGPIDVGQTVKDEKPAAPMDFKLAIKTTQVGAIQIATNLTKAPIPIDLDLLYNDQRRGQGGRAPEPQGQVLGENRAQAPGTPPPALARNESDEAPKPSPVTGTVVVGRTPVELFRRNAALNQLRLDLLSDGSQRLDAQAVVNYLDYEIFILAAGSASDPQIRFVSDPPLDSDQILSVLLFGRTLNELPDDQKASVGNLKAKFADAALGLSSLYLLASTPIESLGYDAERELVTAKVGLGGGTSLEVGGGADATAVGINKRLSRDFVFRSDVEQIGTTGKRTVSAVIEWVKRF